MKNILSLLLIAFFFCFAKCNKDDIDISALPPATQEGRNTLGFMLNGKPWTPKGFNGRANLSIDVDFAFKEGVFGIAAYDFKIDPSEQLTIGIRDSLKFIQVPITLQLGNNSLYGISFNKPCSYFSSYPEVQSTGILNLTKLDKTNRIISGTFNATLYKSGCDTIRITDGRFDMKY